MQSHFEVGIGSNLGKSLGGRVMGSIRGAQNPPRIPRVFVGAKTSENQILGGKYWDLLDLLLVILSDSFGVNQFEGDFTETLESSPFWTPEALENLDIFVPVGIGELRCPLLMVNLYLFRAQQPSKQKSFPL